MAILIDPPTWPAHGTLWSHLVSTASYAQLHAFAAELRVPQRGFDLDHYDVPFSHYDDAVALGAEPVSGRELVRRLREAGLRVPAHARGQQRGPSRGEFLQYLWVKLGQDLELPAGLVPRWQDAGQVVLAAWNESHRHYHDERHLHDVLLSLNQLHVSGAASPPESYLAAWYHDAVYVGAADDEAQSAIFARNQLGRVGLPAGLIATVEEYILATAPAVAGSATSHTAATNNTAAGLEHLLDSDVAIFAASPQRYREYTAGVRAEYAHVPTAAFRAGRAQILQNYLAKPVIYYSEAARRLWEQRARKNLAAEIAELTD